MKTPKITIRPPGKAEGYEMDETKMKFWERDALDRNRSWERRERDRAMNRCPETIPEQPRQNDDEMDS